MPNNIPEHILSKIDRNLHKEHNHPIQILKNKIFNYFSDFAVIDISDPYVSVEDNFDNLLVPADHPSRSPSDTFYKDDQTCLRTHMTCYLHPFGKNHNGTSRLRYVTCGDVYRKDAVDSTHYPIFHQMDALCIVDDGVDVKQDLRDKLTGLIHELFGQDCSFRLLEEGSGPDVYFPFTVDSVEVEVDLVVDGQIKRLEVLGAGTVHPEIMKNLGLENSKAWAFGLGLERLAMVLFDIPDIRLFWSKDPRFLSQFSSGQINKFVPFSKYATCYKDISFFINEKFTYNDLCAIARDEDGENLIESITLIDQFQKKDKTSHCYRMVYRAVDRTLTNDEVDAIQDSIRLKVVERLGVEIR